MKRAIFNYPKQFTTLPDYTAHAGQVVTIVRPLRSDGPDFEYDYEGELMYLIRADDGWEGHAFDSELDEEGAYQRALEELHGDDPEWAETQRIQAGDKQ